MNITIADGSNVNTDSLTDIEAIFLEKLNELADLGKQYNVPTFAVAHVNNKPMAGQNFVDKEKFLLMASYVAFCFSRWTFGDVSFVAIANTPEDGEATSEVV